MHVHGERKSPILSTEEQRIQTRPPRLEIGQDSSFISRTNGHPSAAFQIGEFVSVKTLEGLRKICQVVKTGINFSGLDLVQVQDEKSVPWYMLAEEVGKIILEDGPNSLGSHHKTVRIRNEKIPQDSQNSPETSHFIQYFQGLQQSLPPAVMPTANHNNNGHAVSFKAHISSENLQPEVIELRRFAVAFHFR
jgi:hypothetical protein